MHHRPAFKTHFREKLGALNCNNCYQLLGVDVMLAADLSPMIIEVNGSPSMQLGQGLGATLTQDDISTDYVRPCGATVPLVFTQHAWFAHHSICSNRFPVSMLIVRHAILMTSFIYTYIRPKATTKFSLTADILKMVYSPQSVAAELTQELEQLKIGVNAGVSGTGLLECKAADPTFEA